MPDTSPNLNLPYLLSAQAQKHITLNEGLNLIDALLMLSVKNFNIDTPPNVPIEGERYIIGNNPNGDWANKPLQIAVYQNLGWRFLAPQKGFFAFCQNDGLYRSFDGQAWVNFGMSIGDVQNAKLFGLGTQADSVNPFSLKLNNSLFGAKYNADGGNGDIRLILNKEAAAKSASFIFQSDWSGRAEFGLCGDDNFSIKTTTDSNTWKTPLKIDASSGRCALLALDFAIPIEGNNEYARLGNNRFLHCRKATGTNGSNLFIGELAGNFTLAYNSAATDASYNTALGSQSLGALTFGNDNSAIGFQAGMSITSGSRNTATGKTAMRTVTTGNDNTACGRAALYNNTTGNYNSALGSGALLSSTTGSQNTALGYEALRFKIDGTANDIFSNCTGIGYNSRVSASNQVQLGGTGTTTFAYGAVQDRSDLRDKADVRDTLLGLDFINALRPVDFRWDMRDDYFETEISIDENGNEITALVQIPKDGSKKRNRFHHGLIAQEVAQVISDLNIDFGGYQNHFLKGGSDVQSLGYSELIAPLIKAVQELSQKIAILEAANSNVAI